MDVEPPEAVFLFNGTVLTGTTVVLDANGSIDDNDIESVWWTFTYGGEDHNLSGHRVEFTFKKAGEYPVTLTVVDRAGNRDSVTNTITVLPPETDDEGWVVVALVAIAVAVLVFVAAFLLLRKRWEGT